MIWTAILQSRIARMIGTAVMAVLAVLTFGAVKRREGAKAQKAKQDADTVKAVQRSAEGAAEAKTAIRKGKTPQEVKNANDAKWR